MMNQELPVVGLPEGMFLQREGNTLTIGGSGTARLYQYGKGTLEINAGSDLSYLLG
jgi:dipeptidase E